MLKKANKKETVIIMMRQLRWGVKMSDFEIAVLDLSK
jgi:hypothetical protein